MSEPISANDKWQRMIDAVMVDPNRRTRLATALAQEIRPGVHETRTCIAFAPELADSGEPIDTHDKRVLDLLDREDPALMRTFRDMLVSAFQIGSKVQRIDVDFRYPNGEPNLAPTHVTFAATTSRGRVETTLRLNENTLA